MLVQKCDTNAQLPQLFSPTYTSYVHILVGATIQHRSNTNTTQNTGNRVQLHEELILCGYIIYKKKKKKPDESRLLVEGLHGDLNVLRVDTGSGSSLNSSGPELPHAVLDLTGNEALVLVGESVISVRKAGQTVSDLVSVSESHGSLVAELDESSLVINELATVRELALELVQVAVASVVDKHETAVILDDSGVPELLVVGNSELGVLVSSKTVLSGTVQRNGDGLRARSSTSIHLVEVVGRPLVVRNIVGIAVLINGAGLELLLVVVSPRDTVITKSLDVDVVVSSGRQGEPAVVNADVSSGGVGTSNVQITGDIDENIDLSKRRTIDVSGVTKVEVSAVGSHGNVTIVSLSSHVVDVVRLGPLVQRLVNTGKGVSTVVGVLLTLFGKSQGGNEGEGGGGKLHC